MTTFQEKSEKILKLIKVGLEKDSKTLVFYIDEDKGVRTMEGWAFSVLLIMEGRGEGQKRVREDEK